MYNKASQPKNKRPKNTFARWPSPLSPALKIDLAIAVFITKARIKIPRARGFIIALEILFIPKRSTVARNKWLSTKTTKPMANSSKMLIIDLNKPVIMLKNFIKSFISPPLYPL